MKYFITLVVMAFTVSVMAACHRKSTKENNRTRPGLQTRAFTAGSTRIQTNNGKDSILVGKKKKGAIPAIIASKPELTTMLKALKAAGMIHKLSREGRLTVLAPSNQAFDNLSDGELKKWMKPANKKKLIKVLRYHIVKGRMEPTDLKISAVKHKNVHLKNVEGKELRVTLKKGDLRINGAKVIGKNIKATNGLIYIINKVLLPPKMQ